MTVEPKGTLFLKETQSRVLKKKFDEDIVRCPEKFDEDIVRCPEKKENTIRIYTTCFKTLITETFWAMHIAVIIVFLDDVQLVHLYVYLSKWF